MRAAGGLLCGRCGGLDAYFDVAAMIGAFAQRPLSVVCIAQHRHFDAHFIGMRWAEWTAGGAVPDEVLDNLLNILAHGLQPRSQDGPYRLKA